MSESVLGKRGLDDPIDSPRKRSRTFPSKSEVEGALSALQSPRGIPRTEDEPDPDHLSQPRVEEKEQRRRDIEPVGIPGELIASPIPEEDDLEQE